MLKITPTNEDLIQIPLAIKAEPIPSAAPSPSDWTYSIKEKMEKPDAKSLKETKSYVVINDHLYRRLSSGILAKCIDMTLGEIIFREIHNKTYGLEGPSLARRVQRSGYYWPNLKSLADELQKSFQ